MIASVLSVIAHAAFAGLALSTHRYSLELHSRTGAAISLVCCVLYIGGSMLWGLGTWGSFTFDQRYVLPAILIGSWLLYFGTMQAQRNAVPQRRITIGLGVILPILLLACLGIYVNLATILSPQGYHGYFYTRDYLTYLLINTFLFCTLFSLLWEPIRKLSVRQDSEGFANE
jgi:hypothetical protein